jgi:hypothetical protein
MDNPFSRVDNLSQLKEIKIYKWENYCWKCKKMTPRVSYSFEYKYDYSIEEIHKLDEILLKEYPFVKRIYSKTLEEEVIANTCIHCGSLQGNCFIREELLGLSYEID